MKYTYVDVCPNEMNLRDYVLSRTTSPGRDDKDDAFFVCDLGDIVKKWHRFQKQLPQVHPFYAVKCNPDPLVLRLLANCGVNFDCASKQEIKIILGLGVPPDRIIFANPCKQTSFIRYAAMNSVKKMTFDNVHELYKIKHHFPGAELVIRIRVDDSKSLCQFGTKFGVHPEQASKLFQVAMELKLNVIGVSFHVGSGCYDESLYYDAVKSCHHVFQQAEKVGFEFTFLDIGGGFPGVDDEKITFEMAAQTLRTAFEEFFPPEKNVKIIAEPGRYFVASAYTLACNITSMRELEGEQSMYYVNDGVYGSFSCIMLDHQFPIPYPLFETVGAKWHKCSVWGPTCDSLDCITKNAKLPQMSIGDWLYFENMGAYTMASASTFNGFHQPVIMYMCRANMTSQLSPGNVHVSMRGAVDGLLK